MNLRLAAVSGACFALLAGISLCSADDPAPAAQAPPTQATPPAAAPAPEKPAKHAKHEKAAKPAKAPKPAEAAKPAQTAPKHPPAAIGGLVGGAGMFADADYSNQRTPSGDFGDRDASPRFAFYANFRYAMTPWLRWQVSPGFFWVGYNHSSPLPFQDSNNPDDTTKEKVITLVLPVSAQLQWTPQVGPWLYHVGFGPGVYRVWVENRRKVVKDPITFVNHKGFYPGVSGQIGVERYLKAQPSTAIEVSIASHWIAATRPDQFPSGFNSSLLGVEFRVGANYYFDTARFAKKKKTEAATPAGK